MADDLPSNPVNYVTKFLVNTCLTKPMVYVELAYEAELDLIYSVYQPDIWLVTELVTGKPLGHHGRRELKKAKKASKRSLIDKTKWVFTLSGLVNFTLFWWMVYESVRDEFIWFSSAIMETDIQCPFDHYHHAYSNHPIWGSPMHVGGSVFPVYVTTEGDIAPNCSPQGNVPPGGYLNTTFWLILHPLIGHFTGGSGRVWWERDDTGDQVASGDLSVDVKKQQVFMAGGCKWRNPTPETVHISMHVAFSLDAKYGTLIAKKGEMWITVAEENFFPPKA